MKWFWSILISLVMVGSASVIAFNHTNPNNPIGLFSLQAATLSDNPDKTVALYASGGAYNASGTDIGWVSTNLTTVQGTYQYSGKPYIASAITKDGTSTTFSLIANGIFVIYSGANTGSASSGTFDITFTTAIEINGQANTINTITTNVYIPWSDSMLPSGTLKIPYQKVIVPTQSITGTYNNVVTFAVQVAITSNPENGWGFFESASFHQYQYNLQRQVLILPATASLGQPTPNPVKQGTTVAIPYTTGFAPASSNGSAYVVQIEGSPLFNGGTPVKTYYVGQNVQNGMIYYQTPANSFIPSTIVQGNQFKVILYDNWFPLISFTFFTIDNYSFEPPKPTISILNSPANGQFTMGSSYTVQVNYTINPITNQPINYVDLWIYSATTAGTPAQYITNDHPIQTNSNGNGSVTYTFQLSFNVNSLWIQAQSVDDQGRASQMAQLSVAASNIHSPNITAPPGALTSDIIAAVAGIAGTILILLMPVDYLSRFILIFGWVASVLIIFNAYIPGVL